MALAAVVRDDYSAPFFDAAAAGTLLLRYSPSSGEWSEPAALVCAVSQADDLEWRAACGAGSVVSWTVKPGRARDGAVPPDTVIALVETDEGPWLSLWMPDVDAAALTIGARVRVGFVRPSDGSEHLPVAYTA